MKVHTERNPLRGYDLVRTGSYERVGQVYVSDDGPWLSISFGSNHAYPENMDEVRNFLVNADCPLENTSDIERLFESMVTNED